MSTYYLGKNALARHSFGHFSSDDPAEILFVEMRKKGCRLWLRCFRIGEFHQEFDVLNLLKLISPSNLFLRKLPSNSFFLSFFDTNDRARKVKVPKFQQVSKRDPLIAFIHSCMKVNDPHESPIHLKPIILEILEI